MLGEDYTAFTICVGTKLLEYEDCYLGMRFFNFHHEMFNGTGGNNYLGASCSFIHDLYLHIVKLKLKFNKKTYGSEYIAEILEDILKTDYNFDFSNNERTVISDRINAATKVTQYFSKYAEQVNCEMHQINSAIKYGFVLLENKSSTIAVDGNGLQLKIINSKCNRVSKIVTPGNSFTQRKEIIQNLNSIKLMLFLREVVIPDTCSTI